MMGLMMILVLLFCFLMQKIYKVFYLPDDCWRQIMMVDNNEKMPMVRVSEKIVLTIPEAAALSNIGQNRIDKLLRAPNCPFVIRIGAKKLVKRKEF